MFIYRKVLVLFEMGATFLMLLGCRHDSKETKVPTNLAKKAPITIDNSGISKPSEGTEACIIYSTTPKDFSFRIGDDCIGNDVTTLIKYVNEHGIDHVIIESEYKMTSDAVRKMVNILEASGVSVRKFWMPSSTQSEPVNVLQRVKK